MKFDKLRCHLSQRQLELKTISLKMKKKIVGVEFERSELTKRL